MSGKVLIQGNLSVTQIIDSGKALAAFLKMDETLPETIPLANGARLVLSSKKDAYYVTTPDSCTCKAGSYGRLCRHRKEIFRPHGHGQSMAETLEQAEANLSKMPYKYRRMVEAAREEAEAEPTLIHRGGFRPVCPEEA